MIPLVEGSYDDWSYSNCITSVNSPSSIMSAHFQNQSCEPFSPEQNPCTLGNYVSYSINVTSTKDVTTGLQFAQKHNIRLVIKNTGHEYRALFTLDAPS